MGEETGRREEWRREGKEQRFMYTLHSSRKIRVNNVSNSGGHRRKTAVSERERRRKKWRQTHNLNTLHYFKESLTWDLCKNLYLQSTWKVTNRHIWISSSLIRYETAITKNLFSFRTHRSTPHCPWKMNALHIFL